MSYRKLQEVLAAKAQAEYKKESPLSDQVISSFLEVPRHLFVKKFRNYGDDAWYEVNSENIEQFLPVIYQDKPIIIWGSDLEFESKKGQKQVSTISQPSFVLRMLDLLNVQEGHKVFELGTASGWNAALLSRLVGPSGKVVTAEIIPELAKEATTRLHKLGFENVKVISGDGADGDPTYIFDRVMFTAGAFDFPSSLFGQTRVGSLVLFVLKNKGGSDNLYLLKRFENYFEAVYTQPCGFVPVTGSSHVPEMEEKELTHFLDKHGISKLKKEKDFWWGSSSIKDYFLWQTAPIRGFLSLYPEYEAFCLDGGDGAFGWYEKSSNSLAVASPGKLSSYGGEKAQENLLAEIKAWVDLGMPSLANLKLKIYKTNDHVEPAPTSWVSRRPQSTFVWELP